MKQTPWKRFAFWIRWWYPKQEAEEILSDYTELPDPDLSHPLQIVKDLGVSKGIWRWLTVFGVLTFCLLCPIFWGSLHNVYALFLPFFLILGSVLSFVWFQQEEKGPLSKNLVLFLCAELLLFCVAAVALVLVAFYTQTFVAFLHYLDSIWAGLNVIFNFDRIILLLGLAGGVLGFIGLNRAHTSHRRWRAVYVLGLTILCLCVCILSIIWSMDFLLDAAIQRAIRISVLGLLFTGVSLC